ncbi:MAG TPA: undecaprenyl-phosphate glucose phosphotransferase [Acidobacteriaceae bacterium]|nr:undecaprenyl-phosphate glucose phosphotransferase [Acidobacteriaceae bacterium]
MNAGSLFISQNAPLTDRRSPARRGSRGDRHRLSASVITRSVQASDVFLLLLCGWLTKIMFASAPQTGGRYLLATLAGSLVAARWLARADVYELSALCSLGTQVRYLPLPLLGGAGSMIVCLFLMRDDGLVSRRWPLLWLLLSTTVLLAWRWILWRLLQRWSHSGRLARRVAVIGTGEYSREFIERLRSERGLYTVVGLYDDRLSRIPAVQEGVEVRGQVRDLLERSRQEQVDLIVIALPLQANSRISTILEQVGSAVADICLTTDFVGFRYRSSQMSSVGSNPVVLVGERPIKDWRAVMKSAFDIVLGSLLLVVLSPLLAFIAMAIRLDSPGPILFRQPRLGFNNRIFICYKFRSMRHERADLTGERQVTRGDARVTRLGRWLRALSLDELPQLLNVLKGEMSLVGPRPHPLNTKAEDRLYADVVARYAFRHRVKPGMTGWAQVNGWRGETRTREQIESRVACDLAYIENWSVWFDLRILVLTLTREILSRHAF